jgi:hypothetical protein
METQERLAHATARARVYCLRKALLDPNDRKRAERPKAGRSIASLLAPRAVADNALAVVF